MPAPGARREAPDRDLEVQGISRHDLTAEAGPVYAPEQREPVAVALIGEHDRGRELRERLDHQDSRQDRIAGKMAGEELLFPAQVPKTTSRDARLQLDDL
jgi:hypothetical protein